jgi:O-antigen ligase
MTNQSGQESINPLYRWAVWISVFVFVVRPGEFVPILSNLRLGLITPVLLAIIFVATGQTRLLSGFRQSIVLMSIWLLLGLVTVPFASWPTQALNMWYTILFVNFALFIMWLPIAHVPAEVSRFVKVISICSIVLGSSVLLLFDEAAFGGGRASVGASYDANDMAMVLSACLPFIVYSLLSSRAFSLNTLFSLFGLIVVLVAIVKTGSRGGSLALGAVVMVLLFWSGEHIPKKYKILCSLGVLLIFLHPVMEPLKARWSEVISGSDYNLGKADGGAGRLSKWKSAIEVIDERPFLGHGVKNSETALGSSSGNWLTVHNSYLEIALDLGIVGLLVYLKTLHVIWTESQSSLNVRVGRKVYQESKKIPSLLLSVCLRAALIGYMVASTFLSQAYTILVPLMLIVAQGIHSSRRYTHNFPDDKKI